MKVEKGPCGILESMTASRTVLVTGVAGFIGFHLTSRLLVRDDVVTDLDNLNGYYDVAPKKARLAQIQEMPGSPSPGLISVMPSSARANGGAMHPDPTAGWRRSMGERGSSRLHGPQAPTPPSQCPPRRPRAGRFQRGSHHARSAGCGFRSGASLFLRRRTADVYGNVPTPLPIHAYRGWRSRIA